MFSLMGYCCLWRSNIWLLALPVGLLDYVCVRSFPRLVGCWSRVRELPGTQHTQDVESMFSKRPSSAINPLTAKLFNLNFHPLEVVSR